MHGGRAQLLRLAVARDDDQRLGRLPGRGDEDRALAADDLDRVAAVHVHPAVERPEDVAGEAQDAGEAGVDAVAAGHHLAGHALGLAQQQPQCAHAVAADVHQRAALQPRLPAHVGRGRDREVEAERRAGARARLPHGAGEPHRARRSADESAT